MKRAVCAIAVMAFSLSAQAQTVPTITVVDEACRRVTLERCLVEHWSYARNWKGSQLTQGARPLVRSNPGGTDFEECKRRTELNVCLQTVEAPIGRAELQKMITDAIEASNKVNREEWAKIFQGMLDAGTVSVNPK